MDIWDVTYINNEEISIRITLRFEWRSWAAVFSSDNRSLTSQLSSGGGSRKEEDVRITKFSNMLWTTARAAKFQILRHCPQCCSWFLRHFLDQTRPVHGNTHSCSVRPSILANHFLHCHLYYLHIHKILHVYFSIVLNRKYWKNRRVEGHLFKTETVSIITPPVKTKWALDLSL